MHLRDREPVPAADPAEHTPHPFEGATIWVVPSPLPDLPTAFSRRAAMFGPFLGAAAAMMVPPPAKALTHTADARLVALVDELQIGAAALTALGKSDPSDCEDIPGYLAAEARLTAVVAELHGMRAESWTGILAMARALSIWFVAEDVEMSADLGQRLAKAILLQPTPVLA